MHGNTVVIEAAVAEEYHGKTVSVTIVDDEAEKNEKYTDINLDIFVKPTEQGKNTDIDIIVKT
ncbi:hypothetical protein TPE_0032 [Treponema pedis str. T A4]|uniref:Uncharacterized protein n=1 Tax=Treponema pedis str. T A4 TaxID=1291379 RepID=S5ZR78_9SPIR|nr:hypothetical protein TPE_0032 [Treponema pedis str. T A4]